MHAAEEAEDAREAAELHEVDSVRGVARVDALGEDHRVVDDRGQEREDVDEKGAAADVEARGGGAVEDRRALRVLGGRDPSTGA